MGSIEGLKTPTRPTKKRTNLCKLEIKSFDGEHLVFPPLSNEMLSIKWKRTNLCKLEIKSFDLVYAKYSCCIHFAKYLLCQTTNCISLSFDPCPWRSFPFKEPLENVLHSSSLSCCGICFLPSIIQWLKQWSPWKGDFVANYIGDDGISILKLNIAPKPSDEFWVDCLKVVVKTSYAITQHRFIHIQTNTLQVFDVKEVLNVDGGFILSMNNGNFFLGNGW